MRPREHWFTTAPRPPGIPSRILRSRRRPTRLYALKATTVCGSDLHILRGDLRDVKPGTVLGHEAVGEVIEVGPEVHTVVPGEEVIVSSVTACGHCQYCRDSMYGQCRIGGGWILGHLINGTQAEFVRVSFADHSTHRRLAGLALDDAVLLAEVLPTAYEVGGAQRACGPRRHRRRGGCRSHRACRGPHGADLLASQDHRGGPVSFPAGSRRPPGRRRRRTPRTADPRAPELT